MLILQRVTTRTIYFFVMLLHMPHKGSIRTQGLHFSPYKQRERGLQEWRNARRVILQMSAFAYFSAQKRTEQGCNSETMDGYGYFSCMTSSRLIVYIALIDCFKYPQLHYKSKQLKFLALCFYWTRKISKTRTSVLELQLSNITHENQPTYKHRIQVLLKQFPH